MTENPIVTEMKLSLSAIQSRLTQTIEMLQANVRSVERLHRKLSALEHEPLPGQGAEVEAEVEHG